MVKIYWTGLESLMQSDGVSRLEQEIMTAKLANIEARFLQEFGFKGNFELKAITTSGVFRSGRSLHGGRTSWRIAAADKRTGAVLKRQPGWLGKFL